ncbi:MAG: iron export ABC transporter permease subunit FetB [Deltaproteobacteria bacterium]|jgi:putative ABC transport system permease protein|nr:iron export ABC transporter permease subunit FetB [Deltaproteobacteria bacterium]MBW2536853.1 iron export ABC transporter permease subunit FetB [Deltaproteobacteria bacterium]
MAEHAGALPLGPIDLALSAGLVLVAGLISLALRLGLEKRLAIAALRTVIQLLLVGYVLVWIFRADTPWVVLAAVAVMTVAAARAAVARSSRGFSGVYPRVFLTLMLTGTLTTAAVTQAVIGVKPWYDPQYVIPLLGMVFGNSLTGISLCLDHLLETFDEHRGRIEMALSLGATSWEAARDSLRRAITRGMIPIINSLTIAGLVSLPGMMTGQILAGADPLQAVAYQIVVMFMIAAAVALGCMLTALLVQRRLFNERHQLLVDEISPR